MKIIEVIAGHQSSTEKQEAKRKKKLKQLRAIRSHIRLSCYREMTHQPASKLVNRSGQPKPSSTAELCRLKDQSMAGKN